LAFFNKNTLLKNILTLLLTVVLGGLFQQLLPWYSIALAGFLAAFLAKPSWGGTAFAMGFLGGALLWGTYSAYLNGQNDGLLAMRLGVTLGGLTPNMMIAVTALLGGIYAGLGAICGYWAQKTLTGSNSDNSVGFS
jgi:hypothetical protein